MNDSKPNFTWRKTVTTMTDKFIPGLYHKYEEDVIGKTIRPMRASYIKCTRTLREKSIRPMSARKLVTRKLGNEIMANLPLQMALYFNVMLVPVWFIILVLHIISQYAAFNELYKFITLAIVITLLSIEMLRLYLGYEGNLRDKIPELAGFWMLSVLLQLPLQTFLLLNPYFILHVVTKTIQFIMCILLIVQLISGYSALKYTANKQAMYVRIMNLRNHVPAISQESKYKLK